MKAPQRLRRPGPLPPLQSHPTGAGRLTYILSGEGTPAVLLFNGAGVTLQGWRGLYPGIERLATVFAWNRPGLQGSDGPRRPPTGRVVVAALRELLHAAGVAPPYVLVGHSLGGLYANLFARLHPRDTAGVLLLEATHPEDRELLKKHEPQLLRGLHDRSDIPSA